MRQSRTLVCHSVWLSREQQWNQTKSERRRRIDTSLREAFRQGDLALIGWPAICDWFNDHGFRNREGRPVTVHAVRGWMRRLDCPILRGRPGSAGRWSHSKPWSSVYLLLAWAASLYRSGGPELPRIVLDCDEDVGVARSPAWPPYVKGVRFGVAGFPPPAGPARGPRARGVVISAAGQTGVEDCRAAPSSSASTSRVAPRAVRYPGGLQDGAPFQGHSTGKRQIVVG
jgi:hypothetical protein